VLAQSALDRLAHNAYHVVIEGDSYRKRLQPSLRPESLRRPSTSADSEAQFQAPS
jgi:hypothetical protein